MIEGDCERCDLCDTEVGYTLTTCPTCGDQHCDDCKDEHDCGGAE
jgi:hypothetical protein